MLPDKASPLLSFINLVEGHVLDAIRHIHRVPLKNVRSAINYLKEKSKSEHPLAELWFQTDGLDLFIQESDLLINVSQKGQFAMKEIIQAYLERVERDETGLARRLYPFTRKLRLEKLSEEPKTVVIDPLISFGKPTLLGTGIPTAVIAERFHAGDSIDALAEDYGRAESEIQEALRYEFPQARAA